MNWYYARGDERMGPVDDVQFDELISSGAIREDTLVWHEGLADWIPLARAARPTGAWGAGDPYATESFDTTRPGVCTECGLSFPVEEMVAYEHVHVCPDCKPVFFQRLRESGALPGQMRYGGFWIRFCARFLDGIILAVVGFPLSIVQNRILAQQGLESPEEMDEILTLIMVVGVFWLIGVAIGLAYEVFFVGRFAATPGKMAFGLQIVMSDGGRVSYARAAGRFFATMLSKMTLYIGYIIAGFDDQKRALHDHICDTRVVYK